MEQHLLTNIADDVLWLTINRPEQRNALRMSLLDDIGSQLNRHAGNKSLKCAVITATGDKCFAAGGDLKELDSVRSRDDTRAMAERGRAALDQVRYFPVPVIGALNGLALGGGAELAMACDLRIAAAHAEIGLIQSRLNVTTAWGGGVDLAAEIGTAAALRVLAIGERLDAARCLNLGLVDRVCPAGETFVDFAKDYLLEFTARSAHVLRGCKALTVARRRLLHEAMDELAQQHFIEAWTHPDHWAAAAAALKR